MSGLRTTTGVVTSSRPTEHGGPINMGEDGNGKPVSFRRSERVYRRACVATTHKAKTEISAQSSETFLLFYLNKVDFPILKLLVDNVRSK